MAFTNKCWEIFNRSIDDYHINDNVDSPMNNPYNKESVDYMLYLKNWIDTVQWHLEDIIRDKEIDPREALKIKRRIDQSNQHRTDVVEDLDTWFLNKYKDITPKKEAKINTESPAWAIDRFSILALKIYHMRDETLRIDSSPEHKKICQNKLNILLQQFENLSIAIEELLSDYEQGLKYMKTYKQMKMYNDDSLNPILYKKNK